MRNGEKVTSMKVCKSVPFSVAQERFETDLYTIPIAGFDVILGVKCLCILGPILWDFSS